MEKIIQEGMNRAECKRKIIRIIKKGKLTKEEIKRLREAIYQL